MSLKRRIAGLMPKRVRAAVSVLYHGQARLQQIEASLAPLHRRVDHLEAPDLVTPGGTPLIQVLQQTLRRLESGERTMERQGAEVGAIRGELSRIDVLEAQRLLINAALELSLSPLSNPAGGSAPNPAPLSERRVSIVINTFNRRRELEKTLLALRYLRYPDVEVVVVNGPSTDGTLDMLDQHWRDHVVLATCASRNLAQSRNIGAAAASGDIIVFLDDDAVPEPNWLDRLVGGYDDPLVGAAGGFARDASGIRFQVRSIVLDRFGNGDVDAPPGHPSEPFAPTMPSLLGANSSFRRDVLVAIGGFDERYAFWLEEGDALARVVDAGYRVVQVASAEVHHAVAPSDSRNALGQTTAWLNIARSRAYFALRNAAPGTSLGTVFGALAMQIADVRRHLDNELRDKRIDAETHRRLIGELEQGTRQGIDHSLSGAARATVSLPPPPSQRRNFHALLPLGQRRKIALVTGLYPPRPLGGVAVFMRHLALELSRLGHEVTVITLAEPGGEASVAFEAGVWVHRIVPTARTAPEMALPDLPEDRRNATLSILAELDRVNEHRQVDWVIGALWDTDIAAAIDSKRYRVGVYLVTSTTSMIDGNASADQLMMLQAEKWTIEQADLVLASTNAIRRDLERSYDLEIPEQRLALVPFGVASPAVALHNAEGERVRLVFVGRFEHRKGIDLLFEALPRLMERYPNLDVTLVGDNTLRGQSGLSLWAQFREKHADAVWLERIEAPGILPDLAVEDLVAHCDIFVAPSRYESFGLVYLEAMRYGKPVIGSMAGGIPEVVRHDVDGLLTRPGDAEGLEEAIARLVEDADLRRRLGANGMARFASDFTVERFARNLLAALP